MVQATIKDASWTPPYDCRSDQQKLETATQLYNELMAAQKAICKEHCTSIHCGRCDQIGAVLLNAECVLQDWSLENADQTT